MKSLPMIALALTIFFSHYDLAKAACPSLEGKFSCSGNTKEFNDDIEIRQKINGAGAYIYYLPYFQGSEGNLNYEKTADGVKYLRKESTHMGEMDTTYQTKCVNENSILSTVVGVLDGGIFVTYQGNFHLQSDNSLQIKETLFMAMGNQTLETKATCVKK